MRIEALPSTIEEGKVVNKQHFSCYLLDGVIAVDAGSLALAAGARAKSEVRDVVLTHAHIDHIAGLPLFIDDLFSELESPVRIHAAPEVIEVLSDHIFNWHVYPDFAELENDFGPVLEYSPFKAGEPLTIGSIEAVPVAVNHNVPSYGFVFRKDECAIALSGDTAEMEEFWAVVNSQNRLSALFIECAFPDDLRDLAEVSYHLTPSRLESELSNFNDPDCPIFAINLKPAYRDKTAKQIESLGIERLKIMEIGKQYDF